MWFARFLQWLADTQFSTTMRDSLWAEPLVETIHVLTLTLFLGFAVLLDLRLLGVVLRRRPASEVLRQINPWLIAGFIVMIISGVLLFCGDPVSFYSTVFFKVKMIMLVLAGLNVWREPETNAPVHPAVSISPSALLWVTSTTVIEVAGVRLATSRKRPSGVTASAELSGGIWSWRLGGNYHFMGRGERLRVVDRDQIG